MQRLVIVALVACGSSARPPAPPQVSLAPGRVAAPNATGFFLDCTNHVQAAQAIRVTTLEQLDQVLRELGAAAGKSRLAYETHPDEETRNAGRECEARMSSYHTQLFHDRAVYDALQAIDPGPLDANAKRFREHALRQFTREGIALEADARAKLAAIDEQIAETGQQIHVAIASDTRSFTVARDRLAGLPADWIAAHPADARGEVTVTSDPPDALPILAYADDDALRKQMYTAYRSRGDRTNEINLSTLFIRRADKAAMLGFAGWAAYASDDKMLRGVPAIREFLAKLQALAKPHADREYGELLAELKRREPSATAVTDWQKTYLETQLKKTKYGVDAAEVRTHFPYARTLNGLLALTGELFELEYKRVDVEVWHADVLAFDVMRGPAKLGRIYLDMHPRADKYKHAAMYSITAGGNGALPEAALVCNFGKDLLDHADVVLMFHEFGHVMHHVLGGQQRWVMQSGIATEADFSEAPSMMFEEWAWSHATLSRFTPIPRALVDKMQRARRFGTGLWTVQQLFYAAIALELHESPAARDPRKQLALVKDLQAKYTPFALVDGTRIHASFGHLVDYSSMYYTYLWSLVIAKDMLSAFAGNLLDRTAMQRYRDRVLVPGGTRDAAASVADFLGRPFEFRAYERFLSPGGGQ